MNTNKNNMAPYIRTFFHKNEPLEKSKKDNDQRPWHGMEEYFEDYYTNYSKRERGLFLILFR